MLVKFATIQTGSTFGSKQKPLGIYLRITDANDRDGKDVNAVLLNTLIPGTLRFFLHDEVVFGPLSVSDSLVLMLEANSLVETNSTPLETK